MKMGDVVAAVEKVIDEDFPVAIDIVSAAVEVMKVADAERGDALDQAAEKLAEGSRVVVEIDEDEALPGFDADGDEAVLSAVEIFDSFEFGHAFEAAVEAVVPAVIRTVEQRRLSAGLRHYRGGVVAADVIKGAQNAVVTAHYDYGFAGYLSGDEPSRRLYLLGARHWLPSFAEDLQALEFGDARVNVPGRRNGRGLRKRGAVVVIQENLLERCWHVPVSRCYVELVSELRSALAILYNFFALAIKLAAASLRHSWRGRDGDNRSTPTARSRRARNC